MMRVPLTRTSGLGVLKVMGTIRLPKPAAMNTARLTRYGSSASSPACRIKPFSQQPFSVSSCIALLTAPSEMPSASAISRWLMGSFDSVSRTSMSNSFFVSMLYPSLYKIGGLWAVCVVNMGILHRMFI